MQASSSFNLNVPTASSMKYSLRWVQQYEMTVPSTIPTLQAEPLPIPFSVRCVIQPVVS